MNTPARPKVAVVYYSSTGNVHALAREFADGAADAGAEVRLRRAGELAPPEAIAANPAWQRHLEQTSEVPDAVPDDVVWADAVAFGTPTRYGNVSSQLKQYMDTLGPQWQQGLLADKVYTGFTSTATPHGGRESTLLALYNTFYHWGGIVVTPGYTDPVQFEVGTPYGPSHSDAQGAIPVSDATRKATNTAAQRVVRITAELLAGRTARTGG